MQAAPKPAPGWYVVIYEHAENMKPREEKRLGPYSSERLAEKADAGVNRNLNHEKFYTNIIERL